MSWTTKQKKKSKMWMTEHVNDTYVQLAQKEGWRSRAVFKLKEIDEKDHLLKPGMTVVDLGATPGSWCQYAVKRIQPGGCMIALDLLKMEPLVGVDFIQGDFREDAVLDQLKSALAGRQVDLVLSDMAPNMTGITDTDNAQMMLLAELTLDFARRVSETGWCVADQGISGRGFHGVAQGVAGEFWHAGDAQAGGIAGS